MLTPHLEAQNTKIYFKKSNDYQVNNLEQIIITLLSISSNIIKNQNLYKDKMPLSSSSSTSTNLEEKTNYPLVIKTFFSVITTIILTVLLIFILVQVFPLSIAQNDFSVCTNTDSKLRVLKLNSYEIINIILNCTALFISILVSLYLILNVTDCCQCTCIGILKPQSKLIEIKNHLKKRRKMTNKNKKQKNSVDTEWEQNSQQFQCDDLQGCIGFCCGCRCCKTCEDSIFFSYYGSKNKELAYWIIYLAKTWVLIILFLHIIKNYSALQSQSYCMSSNAFNYKNQYIAVLIIASFAIFFDIIGYFFVCIQGTILQPQIEQQSNPKLKAEYYLINLKVVQENQNEGNYEKKQIKNQKRKGFKQKQIEISRQKDQYLRQSQIQIYTTEEQNQFFSKMKNDHHYEKSQSKRKVEIEKKEVNEDLNQNQKRRIQNNSKAVKEIQERKLNQPRQPNSTFRQLIRQEDNNKISKFH